MQPPLKRQQSKKKITQKNTNKPLDTVKEVSLFHKQKDPLHSLGNVPPPQGQWGDNDWLQGDAAAPDTTHRHRCLRPLCKTSDWHNLRDIIVTH